MTQIRMTDAGYWMSTKPLSTVRALLLSMVATAVATVLVAQVQWTPLQRYYVRGYLKSGIASRLHLPDRRYHQIRMTAHGREFFAASDDLTIADDGQGHPVLVLTDAAKQAGAQRLSDVDVLVPNAEMHQLITTYIYAGQSPVRLARVPLIIGGLTLMALLVWSIPADIRRARERRQGAHLRGAEIVSTTEFNRRVRRA
jgi:hypothetical protein